MKLRSYKKHVIEGKITLILCVLFAIVVRVVYYIDNFPFEIKNNDSYLWHYAASLLQDNILLSLVAGFVCVSILAFIADYTNSTYLLIREKTRLVWAFPFVLYSCYPDFLPFSAQYVGVLFFGYALFLLMGIYGSDRKPQVTALSTTLYLAIGSLFAPALLIYVPLFWIGMARFKNYKFKSVLTSLFVILTIYLPIFLFYLYTNKIDAFLSPFVSIADGRLLDPIILRFDIKDWIALAIAGLTYVIASIYYFATSYRDKIRVRGYNSFIGIIMTLSALFFLLLNIDALLFLYIALFCAVFLLSHFYTLTDRRWTVTLFYLLVITILVISFVHLTDLL